MDTVKNSRNSGKQLKRETGVHDASSIKGDGNLARNFTKHRK